MSPDRYRVVSAFIIRRFTESATLSTQHPFNRDGAGGARGAHNSEVTGSIPVSGIFNSQFYRICHAVYTATHTSRCSSAEERLKPQPSPQSTRNGPTEGWLSAHNGEDVGSKPTAGKNSLVVLWLKTTFFFMTHFSICHSFLDFRYIGFSRHRGNRLSARTLNNILFQIAQSHSRTVYFFADTVKSEN